MNWKTCFQNWIVAKIKDIRSWVISGRGKIVFRQTMTTAKSKARHFQDRKNTLAKKCQNWHVNKRFKGKNSNGKNIWIIMTNMIGQSRFWSSTKKVSISRKNKGINPRDGNSIELKICYRPANWEKARNKWGSSAARTRNPSPVRDLWPAIWTRDSVPAGSSYESVVLFI